jgi:hypothetical protein
LEFPHSDEEFKSFTENYNVAIKAFVMILAKMFMRKGEVTYELIENLYTKVDIENFIDS